MTNIIALSPQRIIPDQTFEQIEIYRDINRQIKMLTKDETDVKTWLAEGHFKTHREYSYNGRLLLTYDERSRSSIDTTRLKEERPEIFAEYTKKITYRQFNLK